MNEYKGIMSTKIELALEQSQQGVSNDVLRSYALSWKPCQGDSLNLPDYRIRRWCCSLIPAESNSLPHAHTQTTKTYYWHQDSRIKKAQVLKTKTFANSYIQDLPLRYQVYQGRLLASFQDDAKYEHVGQDTRSQGGKDDQDKQGKDLKILEQKTKSNDNDKGSRSKITQYEGTSLQRRHRPRSQELNDKSNLIDLMKECHNELTSREIVSLKILIQTRSSFIRFSDVKLKSKEIDSMALRSTYSHRMDRNQAYKQSHRQDHRSLTTKAILIDGSHYGVSQ
ncbi:hypothetical protein Tco_0361077 [Tanacetum coccineum]